MRSWQLPNRSNMVSSKKIVWLIQTVHSIVPSLTPYEFESFPRRPLWLPHSTKIPKISNFNIEMSPVIPNLALDKVVSLCKSFPLRYLPSLLYQCQVNIHQLCTDWKCVLFFWVMNLNQVILDTSKWQKHSISILILNHILSKNSMFSFLNYMSEWIHSSKQESNCAMPTNKKEELRKGIKCTAQHYTHFSRAPQHIVLLPVLNE